MSLRVCPSEYNSERDRRQRYAQEKERSVVYVFWMLLGRIGHQRKQLRISKPLPSSKENNEQPGPVASGFWTWIFHRPPRRPTPTTGLRSQKGLGSVFWPIRDKGATSI